MNNTKAILTNNQQNEAFENPKIYLSDSFIKYLKNLNINNCLSSDKLQKLETVTEILLKDPIYKSLSNILNKEEIELKHYLDSLAILNIPFEVWNKKDSKLLDIGSGAGFPAVPLAVAMPHIQITALDSKNKACIFIENLKTLVGIDNLQVICERAENLAKDKTYRETFDLVICRAVSSISTLLEIMVPFAKVGGYVVMYKGPNYVDELKQAQNAINLLHLNSSSIQIFNLTPPQVPYNRSFIVFFKAKQTPSNYPRRVSLPFSKPL